MTAVHAETRDLVAGPNRAGESERWHPATCDAAPLTLTLREAAERSGLGRRHLSTLAAAGQLDAVKVDGIWAIDGASLDAYCAQPRRRGGYQPSTRPRRPRRPPAGERRLPAGPLLRQIDLAGGERALGIENRSAEYMMLLRARHRGWVSLWAADRFAVELLGLTLWELWDVDDLGEGARRAAGGDEAS